MAFLSAIFFMAALLQEILSLVKRFLFQDTEIFR